MGVFAVDLARLAARRLPFIPLHFSPASLTHAALLPLLLSGGLFKLTLAVPFCVMLELCEDSDTARQLRTGYLQALWQTMGPTRERMGSSARFHSSGQAITVSLHQTRN